MGESAPREQENFEEGNRASNTSAPQNKESTLDGGGASWRDSGPRGQRDFKGGLRTSKTRVPREAKSTLRRQTVPREQRYLEEGISTSEVKVR